MTKLLIADHHPIVLDGLAALLRPPDFDIVARCSTSGEVLVALQNTTPAILILDASMPVGSIEILRRLAAKDWRGRVILFAARLEDADALEATGLSVGGIVLKNAAPRQLIEVIREVERGGRWIDPDVHQGTLDRASELEVEPLAEANLTGRELEIVRLLGRGLRNREIAREASVTEGTVKMHLHNIYKKLDMKSRTELAIYARGSNLT